MVKTYAALAAFGVCGSILLGARGVHSPAVDGQLVNVESHRSLVSLSDDMVDHSRDCTHDEPPTNLFLADSVWPMTHRNPYNQASSSAPGPRDAFHASPQFLSGEAVPITLAVSGPYPNGQRVIWGNTLKHVFKIDAGGKRFEYLSRRPRSQVRDRAISGAYSLVDREGTFFVPRGAKIEAYADAERNRPASAIAKIGHFSVPTELLDSPDEMIVGLNMTYDGRLVFVTQLGLVGTLSRQLDDFVYLRLGSKTEEISNSVAVDETGGIFVVTNHTMNRVQWTPDGMPRIQVAWRVPYQSCERRCLGRLGTGSGTTPSLVGVGEQNKFVVICDGQPLMHMVLYWRDAIPEDWPGLPGLDRRVAADVPVTFGDDQAVNSTTEQSLTVRGHDVGVVSNRYGELSPWFRQFAESVAGADAHLATIYRSNHAELAPHGVEKFRWDSFDRQLTSQWANRSASCPNGIPTMSAATGLFYFIGQRDARWTLEALDWETGRSRFHRSLSRGVRHNSFYAATEIGPGGTILTGTYGGVLRFGK